MNAYDSFDWNKLLASLVKAKTFRGRNSLIYYHELLFHDCAVRLQTGEKEEVLNYPTTTVNHLLDCPYSNALLYTYGKEESRQCILNTAFNLSCFLSDKKAVPKIIESYKIQDKLYYYDIGTGLVSELLFYIRSLYAYGLASIYPIELLQRMKDEKGRVIPDRALNLDLFMLVYHYPLLEGTKHHSYQDNGCNWIWEYWGEVKDMLLSKTLLDTIIETINLTRKEA